MRASRAHGRGHASARPARGSDDSSAAASAAASAALHSVAACGAAQLAPGGVGGLQHAPMRSHPVGPPRAVWRTSKAASGAPWVLYVRFPGACEWWPAECKPCTWAGCSRLWVVGELACPLSRAQSSRTSTGL